MKWVTGRRYLLEHIVLALFVPLEHGIQAELRWHLDNRILTNRLWFVVVAGGPTTADLIAVADGVKNWAVSNLVPLLSQDIRLQNVRAYDATVPYPVSFVASAAGVFGGVAEGSYSANVAVKMEFFTERPPGKWMNWNFIGGIPRSAVTLNTIDTVFAHDLREAYIVLLDVFSLFVYRWEATRAVDRGITLTTRIHHRIDSPRVRRRSVSQRRPRLDNPP